MENVNIVSLKNVSVTYKMKMFQIVACRDINLEIKSHKITALVGESGSGKTTLASAILNCVTEPGEITGGEVIFYDGEESIKVNQLSYEQLRKFRWKSVSMVFQGAQSSLNPVCTIYTQFKETMQVHESHLKKEDIMNRCREVLGIVNLEPDRVLAMYPHELSGGMKQRVMIAFALLLNPKLIILDEPTTALDVITQEYIFSILKKINVEMGISMLLLTHDIGIVAKYSDYVGVMYASRLVEYGPTEEVFEKKLHPYTDGLISATPNLYVPVDAIKPIGGNPPDLLNLPSGCPFHPRCPKAKEICKGVVPEDMVLNGHLVKCHIYGGHYE